MKKFLKKIIPDFILYWYHWKLAFLSAVNFGFPSRKIKVIGVTGTKGKSTVILLAGKILEEAGRKVGWISSLSICDGEKEYLNPYHMTMPGRFFIQKTLWQMAKNGCKYALIEVTSEGIKQFRHKFIKFFGAVFTNLAPEHIEAHGGFENYREAKIKLFKATARNKESFGVYNLDDKNVGYFLEPEIKVRYGYIFKNDKFQYQNVKSVFRIQNIKLEATGAEFCLENTNFRTNLLGEFNVYNAVAAVLVAKACGVDFEVAKKALEKIKSIPGRLELISEGQNFTVIVDFAHTLDSFEEVFKTVKNLPHQKIISVFGSAGGGRDKWKRPQMGKIASENSDHVILTTDDPCDEKPEDIAKEITGGFTKNQLEIILDRRRAIAKALGMAGAGDIVLLLGKGSEQKMLVGDKKITWDDRKVAREELKKQEA